MALKLQHFTRLVPIFCIIYLGQNNSGSFADKAEESMPAGKGKIYLENLLNDLASQNASELHKEPPKLGTCHLKNIEMSLRIADCGRVLFNTTSCSGYCKSSSIFIANSNLVKTTCSGCRITDYRFETYSVKCVDGSFKQLEIKAVSRCSCFKVYDKIDKI